MRTYQINSEGDIPSFCDQLIKDLEHKCVLFIGDLGAGKTTIIKQLLICLGSEDKGASPSFSLINEYKSKDGPIYHVDLYRLEIPEEAFALGIEDYIYGGQYCFIEWPQLIMDYLHPPFHTIHISIAEDNSRMVSLS